MDGGILALILSGAGLLGGAIGWLSSKYSQYRAGKRQEVHKNFATLIEGRKVLGEMIPKTPDPKVKQALRSELNEVEDRLRYAIKMAADYLRSKR